ncbi:hypothetical protein PPSIR1_03933 [Plesiocystis pacifica SIR-1]|uniref:Peptidase S8/S53 domain-containing protein n=1 Tax=Plesiocystis pacifica SIR-1 TaxID=391625 RepID=A6G4E5_9BACT|nr:S8/S53 family peptidase [Plesiocystis pacifica]EDM79257.1 hypothetical protein PPSIR1_03933 [Plesiocystis pacifica SIR-1]
MNVYARFPFALPVLTVAGVLSLAGCPADDTDDEAGDDVGDTDSEALTCPNARVVALLDDPADDCEIDGLPANWTALRLFEEGSPGLMTIPGDAPGELGRYCSYAFDGASEDADYEELLAALDASASVTEDTAAIDCVARLAQANTTESEAVHLALRDAFRLNIDSVGSDELGATLAAIQPVDVGLVDTVSHSFNGNPALTPVNSHGIQMGELIEGIRCPGSAPECVITPLQFHLAMTRESWDSAPNWDNGGHFGSQADIAMGIYDALANWKRRQQMAPQPPVRLVINLSLGWEPIAGDADSLLADAADFERGPSRAVYDALRYAACEGALVFAAAGNNPEPGCDGHEGVLIPATFQGEAAPTASECAALGFEAPDDPELPIFADAATRPLVYAVGGLDSRDAPLPNARADAQVALAALGANSASGKVPGVTSLALTGTSVSTAVASGTAALVWSYRPELRPDEVADLIYASAWPTGASVDAVGVDGHAEVRRICVCAALSSACADQDPAECPQLDCTAVAPAADANLGDFFEEFDAVIGAGTSESFTEGLSAEGDPVCEENASASPFLASPQPELPICPHCNIDTGPGTSMATLHMAIDPSYAGTITAASLTSFDEVGTPTTHRFDATILASLNDLAIESTQVLVDATGWDSAVLDFTIEDLAGASTQSGPVTIR